MPDAGFGYDDGPLDAARQVYGAAFDSAVNALTVRGTKIEEMTDFVDPATYASFDLPARR